MIYIHPVLTSLDLWTSFQRGVCCWLLFRPFLKLSAGVCASGILDYLIKQITNKVVMSVYKESSQFLSVSVTMSFMQSTNNKGALQLPWNKPSFTLISWSFNKLGPVRELTSKVKGLSSYFVATVSRTGGGEVPCQMLLIDLKVLQTCLFLELLLTLSGLLTVKCFIW